MDLCRADDVRPLAEFIKTVSPSSGSSSVKQVVADPVSFASPIVITFPPFDSYFVRHGNAYWCA